MAFTFHDVEFTKDGNLFSGSEADVTALLQAVPNYTDIILISHGWNSDKADTKNLYDKLFASVSDVFSSKTNLHGRKFGVIRIYWPSKKFAEDGQIPGGSASIDESENERALKKLLDDLKHDPLTLESRETDPERERIIEEAKALIDSLEDEDDAKIKFVQLLRSLFSKTQKNADDASDEFFDADELELFEHMSKPILNVPAAETGGAADVGGAAGLRDLLSGAVAGARRIANYSTYYQMKERSGIVGELGVSDLLRRVHSKNPTASIHLAGHSFGGRLISAATSKLDPRVTIKTLILMQAAFSHNGFSGDFQGKKGYFRPVIDNSRVSGPIVITHTKNDQAVGIAYPLASRIAFDNSTALGDRNDPYGGMGRNGAQNTDDKVQRTIATLEKNGTTYGFKPGRIHNLLSDEFIKGHSDITGKEVANAILEAIK